MRSSGCRPPHPSHAICARTDVDAGPNPDSDALQPPVALRIEQGIPTFPVVPYEQIYSYSETVPSRIREYDHFEIAGTRPGIKCPRRSICWCCRQAASIVLQIGIIAAQHAHTVLRTARHPETGAHREGKANRTDPGSRPQDAAPCRPGRCWPP